VQDHDFLSDHRGKFSTLERPFAVTYNLRSSSSLFF
jgi:hypothetical protein